MWGRGGRASIAGARALRHRACPRARTWCPAAPAGFVALPPGEPLRYTLELSSPGQIADLLLMTPHLYRASAEGRARAAALTSLHLTVDVRLTRFERNDAEVAKVEA